MPLTGVDRVRTLIGDMNKAAINEAVANGDAQTTLYQLDMFPVRTGSLTFYKSGSAVTSATYNLVLGTVDVTGSAPLAGDALVATYQFNALSDQEIQSYIDLASAAGNLLAASYASRALAGNAARYFAYTQGNKSVNKDNLSKKFLDLAESLESAYENNINWNVAMSKATFDTSGTFFENYDTGINTFVTPIRYTGTW